MPYVSLVWEGRPPQRPSDPPRSVPVAACISELGLRQTHYYGADPPRIPSGNPQLDAYRDPIGVAVNLKGDDALGGWPPGWYLIPAADLPIQKAKVTLEKYPATGWDNW